MSEETPSSRDPILLTELRGRIALLTLNRPAKRNAILEASYEALANALEGLPAEVRCVVIAGNGPHFCAGLDLAEHKGTEPFYSVLKSRRAQQVLDLLQYGGRPTITAMQGAVIGGGLEMAAATHIRVSDPTVFYQLPEGRRGIFLGSGGSVRVARIIGVGRITEMMLTGRRYDAEEGYRLGLAHYVVEPGKSLAKALDLAEEVAGNAPISNYMMLQALARIGDMSAPDGLFVESLAQAVTLTSTDSAHGIEAFLRKRKAEF
ncbi:MAG: crotonase/enoyl-CoA hydratase family protein [Burkholderiales bacterium]|nr:crotonase/enoyl-CoA hydratase family protein [Burkholderiales bacterium]